MQNGGHWIVFVAVMILGLSVAFYLYSLDRYSLVYYGDSVSHMVGARKVVDWMDPGLQQVGTVWLPLPHFLLLPFTLVDPLFTTGFAGVAASLPCLAVTAALLYKMIRVDLAGGLAYIAFAGAMLYIVNPNILYIGITAMTEAPFMLFFVASAYFLQKWHRNQELLGSLALSSVFIVAATLCRYEGWILPAFLLPLALATAFRNDKIDSRKKLYIILISLASFSGIAFWLGYNAHQYGNPLEFANAQYYSAASQALNRSVRDTLFLQPVNVMAVYWKTAFTTYGPALLAAALVGYIVQWRREGSRRRGTLYAFLVLPPLFTIISLLIGIGEMNIWFNARFLVLVSPLLIMLAAVLLHNMPEKARRNRRVIVAAVAVLFVFQVLSPVFGEVPSFLDAKWGFLYGINPYSVQAGEALKSIYDGGMIMTLTGSSQEHRMMVTAGIPLRQYDEMIESSMWKKSFHEPWSYDRWIVISKEPDSDGVSVAKYWQDMHSELDEHYRKAYENPHYEILVLK